MGPVTTALVMNYGPAIGVFLIHVIAGHFKDKQHTQNLQIVAGAGINRGVQVLAAGGSPQDVARAAGAAAVGAAVAQLPQVTVQDPTVTPPISAGG